MTSYIRNKKLRPLSDVQRSYIAAIIDGEGCVTLSKKADAESRSGFYLRPHVHVSNNHERLLRTLLRWTGLGSISHFTPAKERNRKTTWQWQLWSNQAAQVLVAAMPFLIVKKARAKLLLEFIRSCQSRKRHNRMTRRDWNVQLRFAARFRRLNSRGATPA